ncbi:DUF1801 domain-containing protein [Rhizobium daejeonense]|uniref:DUF1801 domain-containing protein n=1 Tax=Rhizobium daejeonense TaxID=240521 RepID=A0A6M1S4M0_9HYPH|nr:DUF1801 domain-containing protein [Rhizobium daejeonense]
MQEKRKSPDETTEGNSPSRLIDGRIAELGDWRGETLAHVRALVRQADPEVVEEWKWRGIPVWSHGGIICTGETYKSIVKLTFAKGASLEDPARLFNSSLEGNTRRAIDIHEGETVDGEALKALIRAAVALNISKPAGKRTAKTNATQPKGDKASAPVLLSGGNPQIAKGDGDITVQAYIAAMPGWKSEAGRKLDALIVQTVPEVRKAVKWNSPFYGVEGQGWFLSFHCFTRYIKVTFFRGSALQPVPPVASKDEDARYVHIHEHEAIDETQLSDWIRQAAALPGWVP